MKYVEALDHHSEEYNPLSLYRGEDLNDVMIEESLRRWETS